MKKETKRLLVRGTFFALYLALGMVVFRQLESHNEQVGMLNAKRAVDQMLIKYNISDDEMSEFVGIITEAASWGYTSGWLEKWSFTGSLFFSGTVITTIGKPWFFDIGHFCIEFVLYIRSMHVFKWSKFCPEYSCCILRFGARKYHCFYRNKIISDWTRRRNISFSFQTDTNLAARNIKSLKCRQK